MKVIVSHDVDHFGFLEHWNDGIVPKYLVRMLLEKYKGHINTYQIYLRLKNIFRNKREQILELLEYDNQNGIRPTFFIAMNQGVGLSYSHKEASKWVKRLSSCDCEIGIHGICFDDPGMMKIEYDRFADALSTDDFGIRMHYLRQNETTLNLLSEIGYKFDTTKAGLGSAYLFNNSMWVFPLHIMDGWYLLNGKRYQSQSAKSAFQATKEQIDKLISDDVSYMSLNFHDSYFDDSFLDWKSWYCSTIDYLVSTGIEFVSYNEAIKELAKAS